MKNNVVIRGPMGVGKTTLADSLFEYFTSHNYLCSKLCQDDVVRFTNRVEPTFENNLVTCTLMASMYSVYQRNDYTTILEGVFYHPDLLKPVLDVGQSKLYRLISDVDVNVKRNENADRSIICPEKKVRKANALFKTMPLEHNEIVIDTTYLSVQQVLEKVVHDYFS